ncbi:hypothetical protein BDA96_01G232700 [Sorghum bicolor]|uniref:Uncharacterized protein n=1 Tax=Sorghum bicolor TaxID=4558 RepID=A0A921RZ80_SORBI|nr:hypothetical protein BDA96_01G232700 [Sorghum bicolor]
MYTFIFHQITSTLSCLEPSTASSAAARSTASSKASRRPAAAFLAKFRAGTCTTARAHLPDESTVPQRRCIPRNRSWRRRPFSPPNTTPPLHPRFSAEETRRDPLPRHRRQHRRNEVRPPASSPPSWSSAPEARAPHPRPRPTPVPSSSSCPSPTTSTHQIIWCHTPLWSFLYPSEIKIMDGYESQMVNYMPLSLIIE